MTWRLFILFYLCSNFLFGQEQNDYNYFDLILHAKISNYYYEDSVLVVDFFVCRDGLKLSKYDRKRTFILPENQDIIVLPCKFSMFFHRIFNTGKKYAIKLSCPEHKVFKFDIVAKVFIAKYDVWVVNDDLMSWHVCELIEIEVIN